MSYTEEIKNLSQQFSQKYPENRFVEESVYQLCRHRYLMLDSSACLCDKFPQLTELLLLIRQQQPLSLYLLDLTRKLLHLHADRGNAAAINALAALNRMKEQGFDIYIVANDHDPHTLHWAEVPAYIRQESTLALQYLSLNSDKAVTAVTRNNSLGKSLNNLHYLGGREIQVLYILKADPAKPTSLVRVFDHLQPLPSEPEGLKAVPCPFGSQSSQGQLTMDGKPIQPGKTIGLPGAEGRVCVNEADPTTVFKLYANVYPKGSPGARKAEALAALKSSGTDVVLPKAVVYDEAGNVAGILMDRVKGKTLDEILKSTELEQKYIKNRQHLADIQLRLCVAVLRLMYNHIMPFDLKLANCLLEEDGTLHLIDLDSAQLTLHNEVLLSPMGSEETTAPWLLRRGESFGSVRRGEKEVAYALAVVLFQLTCLGLHPYLEDPQAAREHRFVFAPAANPGDPDSDDPLRQQFLMFSNLSRSMKNFYFTCFHQEQTAETFPDVMTAFIETHHLGSFIHATQGATLLLHPTEPKRAPIPGTCSCCRRKMPINHLKRYDGKTLLCKECADQPFHSLPICEDCGDPIRLTVGQVLSHSLGDKKLPRYCEDCTMARRMSGETDLTRPVTPEEAVTAYSQAHGVSQPQQPPEQPAPVREPEPKRHGILSWLFG